MKHLTCLTSEHTFLNWDVFSGQQSLPEIACEKMVSSGGTEEYHLQEQGKLERTVSFDSFKFLRMNVLWPRAPPLTSHPQNRPGMPISA